MTASDDDQERFEETADSRPSPGTPPVEQFTSLRAALVDALTDAPHLRRDRAVIALAFRYADLMDDATDRLGEADEDDEAREFGRYAAVVAKIGPRLEATLDKMGMAPGARSATRGGEADGRPDAAAAALARLRTGLPAAAGVDPSAFVDPAVTDADAAD